MEDQHQYQMNLFVPESSRSKAVRFFTSSHKMKQSLMRK